MQKCRRVPLLRHREEPKTCPNFRARKLKQNEKRTSLPDSEALGQAQEGREQYC